MHENPLYRAYISMETYQKYVNLTVFYDFPDKLKGTDN